MQVSSIESIFQQIQNEPVGIFEKSLPPERPFLQANSFSIETQQRFARENKDSTTTFDVSYRPA